MHALIIKDSHVHINNDENILVLYIPAIYTVQISDSCLL